MTLEEKSEDANNDEKPLILEDEPVDELSSLKIELEDVKDKLARSMADLDNFKKRIERDRDQQNLKSKGIAVSNPLLTEFGIHHKLESCVRTQHLWVYSFFQQ